MQKSSRAKRSDLLPSGEEIASVATRPRNDLVRSIAHGALVLAFAVVALPAVGVAQPRSAPAPVDIRWGMKIPMRDGIELNATLYQPANQPGPRPVVLSMTPYIADRFHPLAKHFAAHGYVAALVDVRGRGTSGGTFTPFAQEGNDGYDTIEWLAKQPFSDGKVVMSGGSYGGFNQWFAAKMSPPHLAAILPVASGHPGVDFPNLGNIGTLYQIQWITFTSGKTPNANLFGDGGWWQSKWRIRYGKHLPFASIDSLVGNPSPIFQTWVSHPHPDAWTDQMVPSPDDYRRLTLPIFTRTGMYDGDQIGALEFYRLHMRHGTAAAKASHYLMIGPWDHGGTRLPQREVGGMTFGDASMLDMAKLDTEWYDWVIKGRARPAILEKRVAYYVTGAEVWKYADSLEAIGESPTAYYLGPVNAAPAKGARVGRLTVSRPASSAPDEWVYDPLDTRPGLRAVDDDDDYVVRSAELDLGGRGLVFTTSPFERPTEISGFPIARLWLSLDVPDTDFRLTLDEVTRAGKRIRLTDTQLRARYRESLREPKLVQAGAVLPYEFRQFRFMSRRIAPGSRIQLVVESPNAIGLQKNYNSGGDVARETAKDARTAHIKLYHEPDRWSVLELPIVK